MGSYEDCVAFLSKQGIELFDYQKEILKAFIENKSVRTARGIGRTFVADCYGKYIAHVLSNNNYLENPDVVFPYNVAVECGILSEDFVKRMRDIMSHEQFSRDFLCE